MQIEVCSFKRDHFVGKEKCFGIVMNEVLYIYGVYIHMCVYCRTDNNDYILIK